MGGAWRVIMILILILFLGFSILGSSNPFLGSGGGEGFKGLIENLGEYVEKIFNKVYNYLTN